MSDSNCSKNRKYDKDNDIKKLFINITLLDCGRCGSQHIETSFGFAVFLSHLKKLLFLLLEPLVINLDIPENLSQDF